MTESSVRRFRMDKLVRDSIPAIMQGKGFSCRQRKLELQEFIYELKRKLLEEAEEAVQAESRTDIIEEMADLFEVIYAMAHVFEISLQQIEEQRLKKEKERGGFNDRVYIEYVETTEGNAHIDYLSSRPSQYQEVD